MSNMVDEADTQMAGEILIDETKSRILEEIPPADLDQSGRLC